MNFTSNLFERAAVGEVRMSTAGLRFVHDEGHIWAVLDWLRSTDQRSDLTTALLEFDMEAINNAIAEAQRRFFISPGIEVLSLTALGHLRAAIQDRVRELDGTRIRLSKKDLDKWLTEALSGLPIETAADLRGINLGRLAASLLVNNDPVVNLLTTAVMAMAA